MSGNGSEKRFGLAVVRIAGGDAGEFLQSQLTGDVETMRDGAFHATAWCNPKGRVEAVVLLADRGGTFELALPGPIAGDVVTRLSMFRIGRDVEIAGSGAAMPSEAGRPGSIALAADPSRALSVSESATTAAELPGDWLRADVEARMPWIIGPTRAAFLPQMLGLDRLGGLSYRKGCYPGQEVIARVHYRGKTTQRTARFDATDPAAAGDPLESDTGRGTVLYAVDGPGAGGPVSGLAVVPADASEGAEFRLGKGRARLVD